MTCTAFPASPADIMQTGAGLFASKTLLAAVNIGLFTKLAEAEAMSGFDIKTCLGFKCSERHVYDFLDTLTGFGFLNRNGILDTALYSNSSDTDVFLDKNKSTYIGGILEMMSNRLYGCRANLEEGLLTGLPQNKVKNSEDIFEKIDRDKGSLKAFVLSMPGVQMEALNCFAEKFDFSKYNTLTDAGGASAMLPVLVAVHQPHINCTSFNLPAVEKIAIETIEKFDVTKRVKVVSGNFFTDAIPAADVITMSNMLHNWDEETKLLLIKKACAALPQGGAFVAIEAIIDDERKQNVFGMMMSLNMLVETGTGFDYTFADFNEWAFAAGFKSTALLPLAGPLSAAIAYK